MLQERNLWYYYSFLIFSIVLLFLQERSFTFSVWYNRNLARVLQWLYIFSLSEKKRKENATSFLFEKR